jgi:hypothetical protein
MRTRTLVIAITMSLAGCAAQQPSNEGGVVDEAVSVAAGPSVRAIGQGGQSAASTPSPLTDHGGPVLAASKTYAIYWGPASDFPGDLQAGMAALLTGFNGSSYLGLAREYMRGASVSSQYMGAIADPSTPPSHAPNTAALGSEVCNFFPNPDPSALYVVFTSNAPNINYCAWHDAVKCNGVTFQVAYIPNQALLPGCSPYTRSNMHCNAYSDGTVTSADSVAHEFMEAITDPHIDAWYDQSHAEIADKCNYGYQSCVTLPNGSWQIQSEWSDAIGGCQQQ